MLPTTNDVQIYEPLLTNMLVAYMQGDDRFVATRVFPAVPVDKDSGSYAVFDKKYWFVDGLQERPAGGKFVRAGYGVGSAAYSTLQWGLEHPIPDENRANSQLPLDLEQAGLEWLGQQSLIRKELAFATDFMTTGVWATDNTTATNWSDYASSDPFNDVRTARRTVSQSTGKHPNVLAMGEIVEDKLLNHPDIIDRLKYTKEATAANMRNALAALLGLERIEVSMAIRNTANIGQNATMSPIIDDDALLVWIDPNAGVPGVTAGKTFTWAAGGGIGAIATYRDQSTKSDILQHSEQWDQKAVATDVGYFFSDIVD